MGNLLWGISKDLHLCRNLSSLTVERERVVNEDSRNRETVGEGERERERDFSLSHRRSSHPSQTPQEMSLLQALTHSDHVIQRLTDL